MDGKDIVKQGYDKIARRYIEIRKEESADISLLQELTDRLPRDSLVLDAGCGAGVPVAKYLSKFFNIVGVDFSSSQIELAKENVPTGNFIIQDLTSLDFPHTHFDAIVSYYAVIHIPREEHKGIIASFYQILKSGGLLLICMGADDLKDDLSDDYLGVQMYWSHFGSEINKKMVEDCGFKIIWAREVEDETCSGGKHLFILARK